MLFVWRKCVKYARALSSVRVRWNHQGRGDDVDGARWWQSVCSGNKKKCFIPLVHRCLAFGRPVVALFSYYPKFFRCQWLVIRAYNDRLNGSRLSARTFINSRAGLFYYFRDTLRKPYNRVCTIKHLITRIYCDKKLLFINLLRFFLISCLCLVECKIKLVIWIQKKFFKFILYICMLII